MPDNCIENGFIDSKGRLWLNPCLYTSEERGIIFFQYDGKQSFFPNIVMDSLSQYEEPIYWNVLGETKEGFLFGRAANMDISLVFMWHPDTKEQNLYTFESFEIIKNVIKNPEGGILVLTQNEDFFNIYHLRNQKGKVKLAEFKGNTPSSQAKGFSNAFETQNQKAWFFIPFEGLAGIDLVSHEKLFYSFQDLTNELINFDGIHPLALNFSDASIAAAMVAFRSDELLLYLGVHHGFWMFHVPSGRANPIPDLSQFLNLRNKNSYVFVELGKDLASNILVNLGTLEMPKNDLQKNYFKNILFDKNQQLCDYTALIAEMDIFKPLSWDFAFFSHNFKQQLGRMSFGGLVVSEIQIESSGLQTYPFNFGVRAMALIDTHTLYFNTDARDFKLDLQSTDNRTRILLKLKSRALSPVYISEDRNLWLSGDQGLWRLNPTNNQFDYQEIGIAFDKFIFINNTEIALFSITGDLYFYNLGNKQTTPFLIQDSLFNIQSEVNDLYYSKEGTLWVAAKNGLWKIDLQSKQAISFGKINKQLNERITSIHPGENGKLWLGTFNSGVLIFDPSKNELKQISVVNGLSNNTITGILSDQEGNRWVGTYDGITVLSPQGEVLFDLSEENGLTHNEFNRTSYVKFPDGRMAFGGVAGINILDPPKIRETYINRFPLNIFLTSISYYSNEAGENKTYEFPTLSQKTINIPAANRYLFLDFAISEYVNQSKHTYSYRIISGNLGDSPMEDIPWINLGATSELTLNNLPVGDYIVEVRGFDHKRRQSSSSLQIPIHVKQFFYRTWWFYALCAFPFILGGWIWIRRILTERKRLKIEVDKRTKQIRLDKEIIAQQVEELQQFDQAKSRFFANISHELRTPLTIILGMVDQVEKQPERWVKEGTKMIRKSGSNLLELVNQILELQKLESGNLKANLQLDDIIPFLRSIFDQFKALGASKNLQMDFISEKERLLMDFDPEKILRITSNLLSNAIKYTPEKGKVIFSISFGKLNEFTQGDHLILTIEDTGHGIHHEELPYIFDRFFQATSQEKTSSGGTGIGLSLTQELVKLLNGEIEVVSQLGEGTTFQVFLPITQKANSGQSKDRISIQSAVLGTHGPSQKEKIAGEDLPLALIVEDNADIAQYLQICLEGSYRILFAKNGQEGIDQALEQIPDIIVCDVMMPKKNGFELCETLKEDMRSSHIPIILLTAKSDVESRIAGLKQGADDYLAKPFNEEELLVRMKNLLEIRLKLQQRYQNPFDPGFSKPKASTPTKEDAFILNLKEVFEAHMDDLQFDLDQLSQELYLSRSQLGRKVKALTGKSPAIYLRSLRLQKARQLLLSTELSIKEICYDVGFSNPAYFSSSYLEEFGETPTNTRI